MSIKSEQEIRLAKWFIIIGIALCFTGIGALIGIPMIIVGAKELS